MAVYKKVIEIVDGGSPMKFVDSNTSSLLRRFLDYILNKYNLLTNGVLVLEHKGDVITIEVKHAEKRIKK